MSLESVLLGMLDKPSSGYDLKTIFDRSARHFWSAQLPQVYATLRRMERDGLLRRKEHAPSKGPARKVYSLTATGRKKLRTWLLENPHFGDERKEHLAQLFYMGALENLEETEAYLNKVREKYARDLYVLEQTKKQWLAMAGCTPDELSDSHFHRYLTLTSGLKAAASRIEWCDESIKRIRKRRRARTT